MRNIHHPARPRIRVALALAACVFLFAGCTTIPKNGALLSARLSEGIQRNQAETEKIITALAATQRAILDEEWDGLYVKVETAYLEKNGISDSASLTQDQRSTLAANMSQVWEDLSGAIDAKEAELIAQSRENTVQLVAMNESVQMYLLSVEKLDASRAAIAQRVSAITGLDLNGLGTLADRLLENFNP
ncbi:MAG TPA: hypothetical protein VMM36_19620 [Opitutaceae bacterium]|nr:hypothetical protein [Opitutaceae bacterium]